MSCSKINDVNKIGLNKLVEFSILQPKYEKITITNPEVKKNYNFLLKKFDDFWEKMYIVFS